MIASTLLLLPVLAQILLTMLLVVWLGFARVKALETGRVRLEDIALKSDAWPDNVTRIANNFNNQFQLPVIFYILCLVTLWQGPTGYGFVSLAWTFVAFRLLHSFIHTTYNNVRHRFNAYLGSVVAIFAMWCLVLYRFWAGL